jgi:hypothetical protein
MKSFRVIHTRILLTLCLALSACAGGGGGGGLACGGCLKPLSAPYTGPKENNAISAKLNGPAFDFLNANWQTLLGGFTGNPIHIPVACLQKNVSVIGDVVVCDQDLSGSCDPGEQCNDVYVTIDNFRLDPKAPSATNTGVITGTATLEIQTGNIMVRTVGNDCLFQPLECHVNFDNRTSQGGSGPYTLTLDVTFSLEASPNQIDPTHPLLNFDIGNVQGIDSINSGDLHLGGENTCGNIGCGLANIGFIKNFIVGFLKNYIQNNLQSIIASNKCRKCGSATTPLCPTAQNGGVDSVCDGNNHCVYSGTSTCIPLLLGTEGELAPGVTLGKFGVPPDAKIAISAAAGGSVTSSGPSGSNTGSLTLGVIGGSDSLTGDPPHLSPCVPDLAPPAGGAPPVPDFDAQAPASSYHLGLAISDYFLNQTAYEAHRSGTLCLSISGNQVQLINTGLFKTFLPSLGLLSGSATQDAPMLVSLRPLVAPTIDIGAGTYDPVTHKPIDPLLTITMRDVVIDIYARIEDRWSRLFTMTLDVQLPLSLIIDGCPQGITPAIGDLKNLITITKAPGSSELLAEDPAVLQGLIPAVISLAQPALASALKPIAVPSVQGFGLHLDGLQGIGARGATSFDDLGLYGELRLAGQCDAISVHTQAQLVRAEIPSADALRPVAGKALPWPVAQVTVSSTGFSGEVEYGFKIDDGLWSTFRMGPTLAVSDPRFLIEGHHEILVRGRPAHGKGIADSTPAAIDFLVDWHPPEVHLKRTAEGISVSALDNVTGPQALQYRYGVGDEPLSDWGGERAIDARAIDEVGKLVVEVRDEAGNVGRGTYRAATSVATSGVVPQADPGASSLGARHGGGCGSASGSASLASLLALGVVLGLRRRRQD